MTDTRSRPIRKPDPLAPLLRRYLETADQEAMEELHRQTRPRLLAAARRIGSPQDAEDSVQSAYLALVARGEAVLAAPVQAWLLTAVVRIAYRRKAVDQRQERIAKRLAVPRDGVAFADEGLASEDAALVRRQVQALPPTYRDPVVLHYLEGLDTDEAASLLDVTPGALRVRLHRARKLLRAGLAAPFLAALLAVPWWATDVARRIAHFRTLPLPGGVVAASLWGTMTLAVLLAAGGTLVATGVVASPTVGGWFGGGADTDSPTAAGRRDEADPHGNGIAADDARARGRRGGANGAGDDDAVRREALVGDTEIREVFYVSGSLRARHEMRRRANGTLVKHGRTETFYVEGQRESVGSYAHDQRFGPWTEWYATGGKLSQGAYVGGAKHGPWVFFHETGEDGGPGGRHEAGDFVNDRRDGEWTIWFPSGAVQHEGTYAAGAKDGTWVERYENGTVRQAGAFEDGERVGPWSAWNEDGSPAWEAGYEADELHGEYVQHQGSGWRMVTQYAAGSRHGTQVTLYPSGEKFTEFTYVNGVLHGPYRSWYGGGRKQTAGAYEQGQLHGVFRSWHANGNPSAHTAYDHSRPVGTTTTWYAGGSKMSETVYGDNARSTYTAWYADGVVREKGAFVARQRTGTWEFRLKDGTRHECTYDRRGRIAAGTSVLFAPGTMEQLPDGTHTYEFVPHRLRTYADGKLQGLAVDFHPGGTVRKTVWSNVDGLAEGTVTRYDVDGNVTATETWKAGEQVVDENETEPAAAEGAARK